MNSANIANSQMPQGAPGKLPKKSYRCPGPHHQLNHLYEGEKAGESESRRKSTRIYN